jgi:alpha-tubulin suppressor-like RCC1 family protein
VEQEVQDDNVNAMLKHGKYKSGQKMRSTMCLPMVLPEELLARCCRGSCAVDLVVLAECSHAFRTVTQRIVVQLLHDVHAFVWYSHLAKMSKFRQLHVVELMARLTVPAMTIFREPVVVNARFGALALCIQSVLPERVQVTSVACGRRHMVSLDQHGHAWAIGDGRAGGISLDRIEVLSRPSLVAGLDKIRLRKVACGNDHTIGMASNGDVFTWGRILGESESGSEWQLPDASHGLAGEAVDISAGDTHVAVVSLMGDTYTWGHNHHGQCGRDPEDCKGLGSNLHSPHRACGGLSNVIARRVACGKYHTVILSADGAVYTFGGGMCGQLGRNVVFSAGGIESFPNWYPSKVHFPMGDAVRPVHVVQIACGDEHTLCLTDVGQAFAFGSGSHGQLAQGGVKNYRLPVPLRLGKLCEVAAGANWSLLRDQQGKIFQAGRDDHDMDDCRLLRQLVP